MGIAKKLCIGVASLIVAAGAFVTLLSVTSGSADAITMGSRRDCNYTDVIINCGAVTSEELLKKYDSNDDGRGNKDIQTIFNHYGITRADISGNQVKKGWLNTNGEISVDGKVVATGAKSLYRVDPGKQVSPVKIGSKTYYIGPVAGNYTLGADVFVFYRNGQFHAAIQASCGNPIVATPKPQPEQPKPAYKCESLTSKKIKDNEYEFTAKASASGGARIAHYVFDFGDGKTQTVASTTKVTHTYAKPGTYKAKLTVGFKVGTNDERKTATGPQCEVTIKINETEKPQEPAYKCESLTSKKIEGNKYEFTAKASASGGARLAHYVYDFGDGTTKTLVANTTSHTYTQPGTYKAKVTAGFKVGTNDERKTDTGPECEVTITIDEEQKQPVYKCVSLASEKINRTTFKFTASATAENGATVKDYVFNFGDGKNATSATNQVNHTYDAPGTYTATVGVNFNVNGQVKTDLGNVNCKVTITVDEEEKQPEYKCVSLKQTKINRTTYQFTASASAKNGAEIETYTFNFGDGKSQTTGNTQVNHTYEAAGTYKVTLTVNFDVNGQVKTDTRPECEVTITVEEEPETPVYKCDKLTAQLIQSKERTFAYTLTYTAEGGADLTKVVYNFGDNTSETFTKENATNVEHQFAKEGTYKIVATLYFSVPKNGEVVEETDTCEIEVTVTKKEMCEVPGKEHLPKDSPECKEDEEMCPVPGKEHLPKDSEECYEPCDIPGKEHLPKDSPECVETPPELPKTGLDMFIGGSLGLGSITAAGYYWTASRRNLLNALLNK